MPTIPREEFKSRIARIQEIMDEKRLDALVVLWR